MYLAVVSILAATICGVHIKIELFRGRAVALNAHNRPEKELFTVPLRISARHGSAIELQSGRVRIVKDRAVRRWSKRIASAHVDWPRLFVAAAALV